MPWRKDRGAETLGQAKRGRDGSGAREEERGKNDKAGGKAAAAGAEQGFAEFGG